MQGLRPLLGQTHTTTRRSGSRAEGRDGPGPCDTTMRCSLDDIPRSLHNPSPAMSALGWLFNNLVSERRKISSFDPTDEKTEAHGAQVPQLMAMEPDGTPCRPPGG